MPHSYQAKFGVTGQDLYRIPLAVIAVAMGVYLLDRSLFVGLLIMVLCGGMLIWKLVSLFSGRIALRVDDTGVTVGMAPPWPAKYTATAPWTDITGIVLWTGHTGGTRVRYVGLERVDGAPELPGSAEGAQAHANGVATPKNVTARVVADSRPITGWRLDAERLGEAVARHAPDVRVTDLG